MSEDQVVICGANAYEQKYYFNEELFGKLPQSVKDELHVICVLFTEEVGGILTICVDNEGSVSLETQVDPDDFYYDEITSGLLIAKIRNNRQELLEAVSLFYRVFYLHESLED